MDRSVEELTDTEEGTEASQILASLHCHYHCKLSDLLHCTLKMQPDDLLLTHDILGWRFALPPMSRW